MEWVFGGAIPATGQSPPAAALIQAYWLAL